MLQADAGGTQEISRAPHDQRWRRISSGQRTKGGGDTAGDDGGKGSSEVWEWNGRRVTIRVSPPVQPSSAKRSEGHAGATRGLEEGTSFESPAEAPVVAATATTIGETQAASASVVPPSLLNDIQDIKAMVQALAVESAGVQAPPVL
eukprot:g15244.t1